MIYKTLHRKLNSNIEQHEPHEDHCAPELKTFRAPLVEPVMYYVFRRQNVTIFSDTIYVFYFYTQLENTFITGY